MSQPTTCGGNTLAELGPINIHRGNPVPPDQELYPVSINKVLNGFVVNVGCKTVVFEDANKMAKELVRYYKNPNEVSKEYLKIK